MTRHRPAPEVERIGKTLVSKHHRHLWDTRIDYYFRSEAQKSKGKLKLGSAKKVTGLEALMATPEARDDDEGIDFFVITIAEDIWGLLEPPQRIALVDHELAHCGVEEINDDGDTRLVIIPHDIEEFSAIIQRHGLWKPDLTRFFERIGPQQLELFIDTFEGSDRVREMEPMSDDGGVRPWVPKADRPDPLARIGEHLDGTVIKVGDTEATVTFHPGVGDEDTSADDDSDEEPTEPYGRELVTDDGELKEAAATVDAPNGLPPHEPF